MLLPPTPFIAGGVILVVMDGAKRDRKLVAYLESQPSGLRKTDVMGVGGCAATDETGLPTNKPQMLFRTMAFRFCERQHALIDLSAPGNSHRFFESRSCPNFTACCGAW